jgi:formylmethanofuran dehydrogenase subunit E
MTGCTLGKGNLIFQDYGKMVFIFIKRKRGRFATGIRLSFHAPSNMKRMRKSKHVTKEKVACSLLKSPVERLFTIRKLKDYPLPVRAKIFPSRKCALCGELTMEPRLMISEGKLLCQECAPEGYARGWQV